METGATDGTAVGTLDPWFETLVMEDMLAGYKTCHEFRRFRQDSFSCVVVVVISDDMFAGCGGACFSSIIVNWRLGKGAGRRQHIFRTCAQVS